MDRIIKVRRSVERLGPSRPTTGGFTLMEILISMFIMTIGILGVVSLQITSLNMNRDALMSIEANQLMAGLVDRIGANSAVTYGPIALGDTPVNGPDCTLSNCTHAQMADYDISQWLCGIKSQDASEVTYPACSTLGISGTFPEGKGSITLTGDEYRIHLQWTAIRTGVIRSSELYLQVD